LADVLADTGVDGVVLVEDVALPVVSEPVGAAVDGMPVAVSPTLAVGLGDGVPEVSVEGVGSSVADALGVFAGAITGGGAVATAALVRLATASTMPRANKSTTASRMPRRTQ
jgi:hypothetical protein